MPAKTVKGIFVFLDDEGPIAYIVCTLITYDNKFGAFCNNGERKFVW